MDLYERIAEAAGYIKAADPRTPRVGVVLGSGLGEFAETVADPTAMAFADIPHFKNVGVAGHAARLVLGRVGRATVAVFQGRIHYYEGHDIADVVFPVRVLAGLGGQSLLLTNAAGGLNREYRPGDMMVIRDHINLMGVNPLRGPNDDRLGPRFPDLSAVYDPAFQDVLAAGLAEIGRPAHRGVYLALSGPSYETPAEIRMMAALGADAVGMSTVPEAIAARHMGMRVAGLSCISNLAAGLAARALTHREVLETGEKVKGDFIRLLTLAIPRLAS
ncbi:MAG: purine-nucleoside phosphorylase [Candidatus Aminicenantes bacterium]|nr:purine-nucleoside phosphorylase [Candidatus Aminicenantes bacterium]MBM3310447.1 purine-nucleoside phosphorylase [Candidatus Aminicenantes bacterium]